VKFHGKKIVFLKKKRGGNGSMFFFGVPMPAKRHE